MASDATDSTASTSSSLLVGLVARDAEAWQQFVFIYEPLVLNWCKAYGLQPADAADIAQEVFQAVDRKVATFERHESGSFRGWLHTITLNAARQLWRQRANKDTPPVGGSTQQAMIAQVPEADATQSHVSTASERQIVLRRLLELVRGEFKPKTFNAFWRTAVDGLSAPEAAAELAMSHEAVRQAKARVLRRLRDLLIDPLDTANDA